ncbi:MAG: DUF6894 family protein [Janthinobacterium lividum]
MAKFFFDFEVGGLIADDEEGTEYPDRKAAEAAARDGLLDMVRDRIRFSELLEVTVRVRDETAVVFTTTAQASCRLL